MAKIVLLGTGIVAQQLFHAIQATPDHRIVQVYGRRQQALAAFAEGTSTTIDLDKLYREADCYLIAVTDEAIAPLAAQLTGLQGVVAHTSGSVPMEALGSCKSYGVFYPLQTFSPGRQMDFSAIPICLEGNSDHGLDVLRTLAQGLSQEVREINSIQRKSLHMAAIFANNFGNHMYYWAAETCKKAGVSFSLLQPLMQETLDKLATMDPYSAQTGPARRHNQETIQKHLKQLEGQPEQELYAQITQSIQKLYEEKL